MRKSTESTKNLLNDKDPPRGWAYDNIFKICFGHFTFDFYFLWLTKKNCVNPKIKFENWEKKPIKSKKRKVELSKTRKVERSKNQKVKESKNKKNRRNEKLNSRKIEETKNEKLKNWKIENNIFVSTSRNSPPFLKNFYHNTQKMRVVTYECAREIQGVLFNVHFL